MKLQWDILLNDDAKFPRLLFFGEIPDDRFRYGLNSQQQYCLYFFFEADSRNNPVEPVIRANISLEETVEEGRPALVLTLLDEQAKNLFSDLIVSIASHVHTVKNPAAKAAFVILCNEWFELFEPLSGQLTKTDLQGIFAELVFLKYLLTVSRFPYNDLLLAWKGPFGKSHDFELESSHFEIKGISEFRDSVHISSEYQLDYLSGQRLFLGVIEFGSEPAMQVTLTELVTDITGLLRAASGTSMSLFWTPLAKSGLVYNSLPQYDSCPFTVKKMRFYNCNALDFPALRRTRLPDSITEINYRLVLNGIQDYLEEDITPFL